jgi:hypothetical protein
MKKSEKALKCLRVLEIMPRCSAEVQIDRRKRREGEVPRDAPSKTAIVRAIEQVGGGVSATVVRAFDRARQVAIPELLQRALDGKINLADFLTSAEAAPADQAKIMEQLDAFGEDSIEFELFIKQFRARRLSPSSNTQGKSIRLAEFEGMPESARLVKSRLARAAMAKEMWKAGASLKEAAAHFEISKVLINNYLQIQGNGSPAIIRAVDEGRLEALVALGALLADAEEVERLVDVEARSADKARMESAIEQSGVHADKAGKYLTLLSSTWNQWTGMRQHYPVSKGAIPRNDLKREQMRSFCKHVREVVEDLVTQLEKELNDVC